MVVIALLFSYGVYASIEAICAFKAFSFAWARIPMVMWIALVWPSRPVFDQYAADHRLFRAIALGGLNAAARLMAVAALAFLCLFAAAGITTNPLSQGLLAFALLICSAPIALPIITIALVPVAFAAGWIVNKLSPRRTE